MAELCQIWLAYKAAEACFWTAEDVNLSQDLVNWNNSVRQKDDSKFVVYILAYLIISIGTLMTKLPQRLSSEIQSAEARAFYGFEVAMSVHLSIIWFFMSLKPAFQAPYSHRAIFEPSSWVNQGSEEMGSTLFRHRVLRNGLCESRMVSCLHS